VMRLTLLSLADDSRIEVELLDMGERTGTDRLDYMIFIFIFLNLVYIRKRRTRI
jgi:hypothetical protein